MELRPYQKECISTIEAQPPGAYLSQMATGLGKTVTFANLPRHGERMLILSHREELVEQPRKYFDCSYGIERATQRSHGEEVVSASVQTMVRRLDRFEPEDFGLIICDEAHHAAARTYLLPAGETDRFHRYPKQRGQGSPGQCLLENHLPARPALGNPEWVPV